MIISRRKFNEKMQEAINHVEKERWMHDKIDRVERECEQRITELHKHLWELEQKIDRITEEKRGK